MAGSQVENTRLIAAYDAGDLDTCYGHGEPSTAGELATVGDREDHRQLGGCVELGRRDDQDGAASALFMPCGRIKRYHVETFAQNPQSC